LIYVACLPQDKNLSPLCAVPIWYMTDEKGINHFRWSGIHILEMRSKQTGPGSDAWASQLDLEHVISISALA
jgi:hypothetical protein